MIAAWACVTFSGDQTLKKQKKKEKKKRMWPKLETNKPKSGPK